jgi:hypothetical protein
MKTFLKLSLLVLLVIGSSDLFALTGPSFLDFFTDNELLNMVWPFIGAFIICCIA